MVEEQGIRFHFRTCLELRRQQGYDFREAEDGMDGVRAFENDGYFEYVYIAIYHCSRQRSRFVA